MFCCEGCAAVACADRAAASGESVACCLFVSAVIANALCAVCANAKEKMCLLQSHDAVGGFAAHTHTHTKVTHLCHIHRTAHRDHEQRSDAGRAEKQQTGEKTEQNRKSSNRLLMGRLSCVLYIIDHASTPASHCSDASDAWTFE